MKKTSTHPLYAASSPHSGQEQQPHPHGPKETTLHFLRLFARTYYADSRLPEGFQGLMLN